MVSDRLLDKAYADDIALFGRDIRGMNRMSETLEREVGRLGLEINQRTSELIAV